MYNRTDEEIVAECHRVLGGNNARHVVISMKYDLELIASKSRLALSFFSGSSNPDDQAQVKNIITILAGLEVALKNIN